MIMSQSTTFAPSAGTGGGILTMPGAIMKRLCAAFIAWRMERSAIAVLRSMSDRALSDIGLTRGEIANAVWGRAAHRRTCLPEW
jgi:uncharacterized protein YjiS (DUF1127 family)